MCLKYFRHNKFVIINFKRISSKTLNKNLIFFEILFSKHVWNSQEHQDFFWENFLLLFIPLILHQRRPESQSMYVFVIYSQQLILRASFIITEFHLASTWALHHLTPQIFITSQISNPPNTLSSDTVQSKDRKFWLQLI